MLNVLFKLALDVNLSSALVSMSLEAKVLTFLSVLLEKRYLLQNQFTCINKDYSEVAMLM